MKAGFPPIDIEFTDRLSYYKAFDEYHSKHSLKAMEDLFAGYINRRLDAYLAMLKKEIKQVVDWSKVDKDDYLMEFPLRNLEEWEAGRRKMPDYLLRLFAYYIRTEKDMSQKKWLWRRMNTMKNNNEIVIFETDI